jgi:hypothetical protein
VTTVVFRLNGQHATTKQNVPRPTTQQHLSAICSGQLNLEFPPLLKTFIPPTQMVHATNYTTALHAVSQTIKRTFLKLLFFIYLQCTLKLVTESSVKCTDRDWGIFGLPKPDNDKQRT